MNQTQDRGISQINELQIIPRPQHDGDYNRLTAPRATEERANNLFLLPPVVGSTATLRREQPWLVENGGDMCSFSNWLYPLIIHH